MSISEKNRGEIERLQKEMYSRSFKRIFYLGLVAGALYIGHGVQSLNNKLKHIQKNNSQLEEKVEKAEKDLGKLVESYQRVLDGDNKENQFQRDKKVYGEAINDIKGYLEKRLEEFDKKEEQREKKKEEIKKRPEVNERLKAI
jgi:molecular chaperone DnaK (HSP70)